jgi:multisubunit Na+/H+ antiporter MnhB subunit
VTAARNVGIVLVLAAVVAFLPGGGSGASLVGAILSTLIMVSFVLLAARFYRERRYDIDGLGDRWRAVLYGAIALIVLAMAARVRLFETGAGTLAWIVAVAGAAYGLYLVWRHHRSYA